MPPDPPRISIFTTETLPPPSTKNPGYTPAGFYPLFSLYNSMPTKTFHSSCLFDSVMSYFRDLIDFPDKYTAPRIPTKLYPEHEWHIFHILNNT